MNALTLGTSAIRQLDGLYSLNDLHAASGGEAKHKPANLIRLDTTQALIAEIKCSDVSISHKVTRGATGGTYVCRELVYAYAMWISAKFHLKVIRAFDVMQGVGIDGNASRNQIEDSYRLAAAVVSPVAKAIQETQNYEHRRWMLAFDHEMKPFVKPIPNDACVMSVEELLVAINEPNGMCVAPEKLYQFVFATLARLERNHEYLKSKAAGKPVKLHW